MTTVGGCSASLGGCSASRIRTSSCLIVACALLFAFGASARGQGLDELIAGGASSVGTLICDMTGEPGPSDRWEMPVETPSRPFVGFNEDVVAGVHGVTPVEYVGHVKTIGGNAIRTNIDWRNAEPKRDCWDDQWWSNWRELYAAAITRGVRPVFIIGSAPDWARGEAAERACKGFANCSFPPSKQMNEEWKEFAAEVATRFPQALIEIWNEPNLRSMWSSASGPNPERFAELVVLADEAIEAASPETETVLGGLLGVRRPRGTGGGMPLREFLTRAYAADASIAGRSDYLGLHPYTTRARIGRKSAFRQSLRIMRMIRDRNGDPAPILITEFGVSTASPTVDETRQTMTLDRVHDLLLAAPDVAGVIYHRVIEPRDTTDDPLEIGYAWLRYGSTPPEPRPVYCRFARRAGNSYRGC